MGVAGLGGACPRVGGAEADIMRVNSPGAAPLGGGGKVEGRCTEKAPVAEPPEPKGGPSGCAGADPPRPLGLPNIWVNSPGCWPDGRLVTGVGMFAEGGRWFPPCAGCIGDWKNFVNSLGASLWGGGAPPEGGKLCGCAGRPAS